MFAGVVVAVDSPVPQSGAGGVTGAAFVTALVLLPHYHWLHRSFARLAARDRTVALGQIKEFVRQVRDGRTEPKKKAFATRCTTLASKRSGEQFDLLGSAIPLQTSDATVGALCSTDVGTSSMPVARGGGRGPPAGRVEPTLAKAARCPH
jgi:hypothetical protein